MIVLLLLARDFGHQAFAVGDRDLVIVRVDFAEGQKTVAIAPEIDERRLQRRFDPGYLCEVDIAGELPLVLGLEVEFLDLGSVHHDHAGFLRMGRVDKHFLCHSVSLQPLHPGGRQNRNNLAWGCLVAARTSRARRHGRRAPSAGIAVPAGLAAASIAVWSLAPSGARECIRRLLAVPDNLMPRERGVLSSASRPTAVLQPCAGRQGNLHGATTP